MPMTDAIATEYMKQALPGVDPKLFDKKCITSKPSNRHFPGPYSLKDLYLDGRALVGAPPDSNTDWGVGRGFLEFFTGGGISIAADGTPAVWVSSSADVKVNEMLPKLKDLPRAQEQFDADFAKYEDGVKKTTSAAFKYGISKLPLEDQQRLQYGEITVRREIDYDRPDLPQRTENGVLLFETKLNINGKLSVMTYAYDRLKGTFTRRPDKTYEERVPSEGWYPSKGKKYDLIKPAGQHPPGITDERQGAQGVPNSFSSDRTQYLIDAVIEDMDLPAVRQYAKGASTFETEVPTYKIVGEIALNLIPLRSAITNFKEGKITEGIVDLAFDVFGFAVGLGAAAKAAKAVSAGASALSKAGRAIKIIGRAAVGALNPVDGIDDLARGVFRAGHFVGGKAYKGIEQLRGAYRGSDLLGVIKNPNIAEGTYKAANRSGDINTLAKLDDQSGNWFNVNPHTGEDYGNAIEGFKAQKSANVDDTVAGVSATEKTTRKPLLEQGLAYDNVIQLGGTMKGFKFIDSEVHVFYDTYKGTERLNIVAHGKPYVSNGKRFSPNNAEININGKPYSAADLVTLLKSKGVDPKKFDNVRLLICHSAEGGSRSFGRQLQKVIKKPVKAFEGPVTISYGSTGITESRKKLLAQFKKDNPGVDDAYAEFRVNDEIRVLVDNKLSTEVFKEHGSTIKITVGYVNNKPILRDAVLNYRPKKFS
jgi:hypothetical protein